MEGNDLLLTGRHYFVPSGAGKTEVIIPFRAVDGGPHHQMIKKDKYASVLCVSPEQVS
jgi:hypothetical protein